MTPSVRHRAIEVYYYYYYYNIMRNFDYAQLYSNKILVGILINQSIKKFIEQKNRTVITIHNNKQNIYYHLNKGVERSKALI